MIMESISQMHEELIRVIPRIPGGKHGGGQANKTKVGPLQMKTNSGYTS